MVGTDVNLLVVSGSASGDTFLLRKNLIANLSDRDSRGLFFDAELVHYDEGVNGGVIVNGLGGDDAFALDDTSTTVTVNGDEGNDVFRIGQLFTPVAPGGALAVAVPLTDFVLTTRGYLTRGVSYPATVNGGSGNDSSRCSATSPPCSSTGTRGRHVHRPHLPAQSDPASLQSDKTTVDTGEGRDLTQYVINAPVQIDGGSGYDTVIVVGTEVKDAFVVTKNGVYGAGRYVGFVNIERLMLETMQGDDEIYVQSTNPLVETYIFGGLGSDKIEVAGRAPAVVADDLLGHSGLVFSGVESSDTRWRGIPVDGIAAEIVDADAPAIVFDPPSGGVTVRERAGAGVPATYTVKLSKQPRPGETVTLTVNAPPEDPTKVSRNRAIELSLDGGRWDFAVTIAFTAANWDTARTVQVRAIDDDGAEGETWTPIQTRVVSTGDYAGLQVANLLVRTLDDDGADVIVTEPSAGLVVVEGDANADTDPAAVKKRRTYRVELPASPPAPPR